MLKSRGGAPLSGAFVYFELSFMNKTYKSRTIPDVLADAYQLPKYV